MDVKFDATMQEWDPLLVKPVWAWKYLDIEGGVVRMVKEVKLRHAHFWRSILENKSALLVWNKEAGM